MCNHIAALYPKDVTLLLEPVEEWQSVEGNNILELCYNFPQKYAFCFQSFVQLTVLRQYSQQVPTKIKLCERSLHSARYCFVPNFRAEGILNETEFAVLKSWFNHLESNFSMKPDAIIYLRTSPEVSYQRLIQRDRAEETRVSCSYLKKLHNYHEDWLIKKTHGATPPVYVVNGDEDLSTVTQIYDQVAHKVISAGFS